MQCFKCNAEMFNAKLYGDAYRTGIYLQNKKKGMFEQEKLSSVSCYVCPECGYIELKADEPHKVKLD